MDTAEKKVETEFRNIASTHALSVERVDGYEASKKAQKDILDIEKEAMMQVAIWMKSGRQDRVVTTLNQLAQSQTGARIAGRILQSFAAGDAKTAENVL